MSARELPSENRLFPGTREHWWKPPSVRWGAPGFPESLSRGLQKGQAPAGRGTLPPWFSACPRLWGSRPALGENPFSPRPTAAGHLYNVQVPAASSSISAGQRKQGSAGRRSHIPPTFHVVSGKEQGIPFFSPFPFKLGRLFPGKVPRGSTGADIRIHPGEGLVWGTSRIQGPAHIHTLTRLR